MAVCAARVWVPRTDESARSRSRSHARVTRVAFVNSARGHSTHMARARQRHPRAHRASPRPGTCPASAPAAAALARIPRVRRAAPSARKQAQPAHLTTAQLAADPAHPFSTLDVCGDGTHTHTHTHGIRGECE
ncbi:hypothetical protein C8F04DRAFT_1271857 [Mycena alexandri]|uniref:Uncharacterized protein n=1 Tax=Mycena alexandri TaxID=1745969 RepID=A0AAD6WVU0_9AGAR|nr:hypothetical protein C8F04DRAFT_1271857 [Mycena alexandri]